MAINKIFNFAPTSPFIYIITYFLFYLYLNFTKPVMSKSYTKLFIIRDFFYTLLPYNLFINFVLSLFKKGSIWYPIINVIIIMGLSLIKYFLKTRKNIAKQFRDIDSLKKNNVDKE